MLWHLDEQRIPDYEIPDTLHTNYDVMPSLTPLTLLLPVLCYLRKPQRLFKDSLKHGCAKTASASLS